MKIPRFILVKEKMSGMWYVSLDNNLITEATEVEMSLWFQLLELRQQMKSLEQTIEHYHVSDKNTSE
jgi:hypothetical protein